MSDTVYPDSTKVVLPEPYLIAIGKVCVLRAQLETSVEFSLAKLAGFKDHDERAKIVTTHMTWPLRMDILAALIESLEPAYPQLTRFKSVTKPLLIKAQNGRNKVVHAFWGYDPIIQQVTILSASARGKLKTKIEPVSVDDINQIADNVGRANAGMWKLILNK